MIARVVSLLLVAFVLPAAMLAAQSYPYDKDEYNSRVGQLRDLLVGTWIDYSTSYTVFTAESFTRYQPERDCKSIVNAPLVNTNERKDEWIEFKDNFSGTRFAFGREEPLIWRIFPLLAKRLDPSKQNGPSRVVRDMFQMNVSSPQGELVYEVVVVEKNMLLLQYIMDTLGKQISIMNKILIRKVEGGSQER